VHSVINVLSYHDLAASLALLLCAAQNTPAVPPALTDITDSICTFTFTFTNHQPLDSAACSVCITIIVIVKYLLSISP
jgi:hypothetical protein